MIHEVLTFRVDGIDTVFCNRVDAVVADRKIRFKKWYLENPIWASRSGNLEWETFEAWLMLYAEELAEFICL